MAGLAAQALTTGGFAAAVAAYATAAITLVVLILAAAALTILGPGTRDQMRSAAPLVKTWGGWILIAVGTWFILLSAFAARFSDLFPV